MLPWRHQFHLRHCKQKAGLFNRSVALLWESLQMSIFLQINDIATNNLTPHVIPFSLVLTASYRTVIYFSNKQFVQEGEVLVI